MKVELVNEAEAQKRADDIKDLAFSIAEANDTLPAYSNAPECQLWIKLSNLATQLKGTEVAIFINDKPAEQLTDFEVERNSRVIAVICADNVKEADIINDELVITFKDNVKEYFKYVEVASAWKFDRSNTKIKVPFSSPN